MTRLIGSFENMRACLIMGIILLVVTCNFILNQFCNRISLPLYVPQQLKAIEATEVGGEAILHYKENVHFIKLVRKCTRFITGDFWFLH